MARRRTERELLSFSWKREAQMAMARQRLLLRLTGGSAGVLGEEEAVRSIGRYSMMFAVLAAAVIGALALTL